MADVTAILRYDVNLEKGYEKHPLPVDFGTGDTLAHKIIITAFRGTQEVALVGETITAYVNRADNTTVVVAGTIEAGKAVILLTEQCYAINGRVSIVVKMSEGDPLATVMWLEGHINRTSNNAFVDPGEVFPTLDTLLAQIEQIKDATERAEEAADRAEDAADRAEGAGGSGGGGGTGTVTSVNGIKPDAAGNVEMEIPQAAEDVGADPAGTAASKVSTHNADEDAHPAIRQLISDLSRRLSALADSDDTTLDQLSEIVTYIKANKTLIDSITTGKVSTADIVNNLTSTATNKPLSAAQGKVLKALIDAIVVPTKVSAFENDAGYAKQKELAELAEEIDAINNAGYIDEATLADELAKRGQLKPEFANSVEECTDQSKLYVLPDGYIYAYMTKEVTTPTQKVPNFTNLMDDPNAYTKHGYRYSQSSGAFKAESSECAVVVPCPTGSVTLRVNPYAMGNYPYIYGGTTNQAFPTTVHATAFSGHSADADGTVTVTFTNSACSYITFCVGSGLDVSSLIVTANEEITYREEGGTEIITGWANTGHAFVPADYEGRIIAAEESIVTHGNQIAALEKKVENINADASKEAAYARIKNWNYPIYEDSPVFLLETNKPALASIGQCTTVALYAKYDSLMAEHSHYITRENCGMASDGTTPIYAYHFCEPDHRVTGGEKRPVILACSGVHLEWTGMYSLYLAMEEIATNPKLLDLRRNVHFVIVPMINPTAVLDTEFHMRNPDGIQVHTNFEVEHGSNGAVYGDYDYGGETPLSIPETQYFDALMAEYQDDIACVLSCHNNVSDGEYNTAFIWCSCGTKFMFNFGNRLADKMSAAWLEKHGDAFVEGVRWANNYALENFTNGKEQPEWDLRVGWASMSGTGGSEYKHGMKYGIHGINVEVCPRCVLDKDYSATDTSNVMTWGTETYVNFFRTYMAVYDIKNKKDYAPNLPWTE